MSAALIRANFRLLLFFRGVFGLTLSHSFRLGRTFTNRRFLHLAVAAVIYIYRSEMSFSFSLSISCGRTPAKRPIAKYLTYGGSNLRAVVRSLTVSSTEKIFGEKKIIIYGPLDTDRRAFLNVLLAHQPTEEWSNLGDDSVDC